MILLRVDGWPAGRPAGWPNLKIMLTSAQLGLAGAWAELGKNTNLAAIGHDNEYNSLKSICLTEKKSTRPLRENSGFFDEPSIFAASISVYFPQEVEW